MPTAARPLRYWAGWRETERRQFHMLLPRQNGEAEHSTCQAGFKGAQPGHTTGQMTADRGNSLPSLTSPVAHLTARPHKRTVESKPLVSYYVGLCPHVTPRGAAVCADQKHQSCNFQRKTSNSSVPLSSRSTGSKNIRPSENIINSSTNVKAFLLERPPLVIKWACAQKKKKKVILLRLRQISCFNTVAI